MEQIYGGRRDGSYYTRVEWANHTQPDPMLWVCNLINDDQERNGGTFGANSYGPVDVVLSFFGETQKVGKIRFYRNVGATVSILEELAKLINVYVSETDEPRTLRTKDDQVNSVPWKLIASVPIEKSEGWTEVILGEPVTAKYVRLELTENQGTELEWTEINECKLYP